MIMIQADTYARMHTGAQRQAGMQQTCRHTSRQGGMHSQEHLHTIIIMTITIINNCITIHVILLYYYYYYA